MYTVRGVDRSVLRGVSFSIAPGEAYGLVGESGCGKSTTAYAAAALPALQRQDRRRPRAGRRRRRHRHDDLAVAAVPGDRGVDGVPGSGAGDEPIAQDRPSADRELHAARSAAFGCREVGARGTATRAHRRPGERDGSLPVPALRWHATTRRHRDGAGLRPEAPRPRRADHRSRCHGGSGGARPRTHAARGEQRGRAVDRPQPRHHPLVVRPGRRDVRRQDRRGGPQRRGVRQPSAPVHRGSAAVAAAPRRAQDRAGAHHDPGHPAADRQRSADVRVRRPLPAGRRDVPHGRAAGRAGRRRAAGGHVVIIPTASRSSSRPCPTRRSGSSPHRTTIPKCSS